MKFYNKRKDSKHQIEMQPEIRPCGDALYTSIDRSLLARQPPIATNTYAISIKHGNDNDACSRQVNSRQAFMDRFRRMNFTFVLFVVLFSVSCGMNLILIFSHLLSTSSVNIPVTVYTTMENNASSLASVYPDPFMCESRTVFFTGMSGANRSYYDSSPGLSPVNIGFIGYGIDNHTKFYNNVTSSSSLAYMFPDRQIVNPSNQRINLPSHLLLTPKNDTCCAGLIPWASMLDMNINTACTFKSRVAWYREQLRLLQTQNISLFNIMFDTTFPYILHTDYNSSYATSSKAVYDIMSSIEEVTLTRNIPIVIDSHTMYYDVQYPVICKDSIYRNSYGVFVFDDCPCQMCSNMFGTFEAPYEVMTGVLHGCVFETPESYPSVFGLSMLAYVLRKYPSFTVRDMQHILVKSALVYDAYGNETRRNASRPFYTNNNEGFGTFRLARVLDTAANWTSMGSARVYVGENATLLPRVNGTSWSDANMSVLEFDMSSSASNAIVDEVILCVNMSRPVSDIEIDVESPSGKRYSILSREYVFELATSYCIRTFKFWSSPVAGKWRVYAGTSGIAGNGEMCLSAESGRVSRSELNVFDTLTVGLKLYGGPL